MAVGVTGSLLRGSIERGRQTFRDRHRRDRETAPPTRLTGAARAQALTKQAAAVAQVKKTQAQQKTFGAAFDRVMRRTPTFARAALALIPGGSLVTGAAVLREFMGLPPAKFKPRAPGQFQRGRETGAAPVLQQGAAAPIAAPTTPAATRVEPELVVQARTEAAAASRQKRGLASTIKTTSRGLLTPASIGQKKLLGA